MLTADTPNRENLPRPGSGSRTEERSSQCPEPGANKGCEMSFRRLIPKRGLTLIEVLVALAILAVAILPMVIGFWQSLVTTNESSISVAASSILRGKAEELKGEDFDALDSEPRETRDLNPGDGFFEVAVTVETVRPNDAAGSGLKKAEVSVYRAGGAQRVAIATTYLTPFGI
jgi:prepilin-type N-terminal cleavage/methylation domain-containing protein